MPRSRRLIRAAGDLRSARRRRHARDRRGPGPPADRSQGSAVGDPGKPGPCSGVLPPCVAPRRLGAWGGQAARRPAQEVRGELVESAGGQWPMSPITIAGRAIGGKFLAWGAGLVLVGVARVMAWQALTISGLRVDVARLEKAAAEETTRRQIAVSAAPTSYPTQKKPHHQ